MTSISQAHIDELSAQLQQASHKQTGTLISDTQGNVLAASGDLKESADRVARTLLTLLQDSNGLLTHAATPADGVRDELARLVVAFKNYQYAITLTNELIACVKTNLD